MFCLNPYSKSFPMRSVPLFPYYHEHKILHMYLPESLWIPSHCCSVLIPQHLSIIHISPVESTTISPGTKPEESIFISFPSLSTVACGEDNFFRASIAFSALLSCITPVNGYRMVLSGSLLHRPAAS